MQYIGEYPYGTEILELPQPGTGYTNKEAYSSPVTTSYANPFVCQNTTNTSSDAQFWFRWITGHQVMLGFWNILVNELKANTLLHNEQSLTRCIQILNACSVIFDYTGSCPHEFYHQKLRIFMALFHSGFSGMWAADYRPLPRLIRKITGVPATPTIQLLQKALKTAYQNSQRSHLAVVEKLVPQDASLLKKAKREGFEHPKIQKHHFMIYDCFFLIHRTSITKPHLLQNLERRAQTIIHDLQNNPITPSQYSPTPIKTIQKTIANIKETELA